MLYNEKELIATKAYIESMLDDARRVADDAKEQHDYYKKKYLRTCGMMNAANNVVATLTEIRVAIDSLPCEEFAYEKNVLS